MSAPSEIARLFDAAAAHAMAFREGIGSRPQRPSQDYAATLRAFQAPTPERGTPGVSVLEELVELSTPGLGAMTGSRFFAWVIGGSHPVGVAADWLTSAWGQNAGNNLAAPAAAAAEAVAAAWLVDLLDLPGDASVGFTTGATVANFTCLAAARSDVLARAGWDVEADGLFGAPPIRVLIGEEAHSTVFAGLQMLGLGRERVVRVETDDQGRMLPSALAKKIAQGSGPAIVVTQAGQINTGAFDPFVEIVPIAREHGAWVHVDGAFGLWARACPSKAHLASGAEQADSWATDGHKWLQTPYDCGYAIVRHAEAHRRAMTILASYLPVSEGDRDPTHFVPELSRRARGFATWAMIRHLGRDGIAAMVERHCEIARGMAERLAREPGIAIRNGVELNQVIVRFGADEPAQVGDDLTRRTIQTIQTEGTCFAGGASWRGEWIMRLSVIGAETTDADAEQSVAAIVKAWRAVRQGAIAMDARAS